MSQVHQSRSELLPNGIESSALHLREEKGMETEVAGKEETEASGAEGGVKKGSKGSKGRAGSERDPNLDHEAVKLYRDTFQLCPNWGFRKDIAVTVKDLELFKDVLELWKEQRWNPMKISWMLSEYERRQNR